MDLFARLQYRLLANNPVPPKTLREPPRPIPTKVERAADVPEHLLAMAPEKVSTTAVPYSPQNQRLHEVTETGDIGGPTSKEDWGADVSFFLFFLYYFYSIRLTYLRNLGVMKMRIQMLLKQRKARTTLMTTTKQRRYLF